MTYSQSIDESTLREMLQPALFRLDEREQRLVVASVARALGHGAQTAVSQATGISRGIIYRGIQELETGLDRVGDHRRRRPESLPFVERNPGLVEALENVIIAHSGNEDGSPIRWTCQGTVQLAEILTGQGHPVTNPTVYKALRELGYWLAPRGGTFDEPHNERRSAQMQYVTDLVVTRLKATLPVVVLRCECRSETSQVRDADGEIAAVPADDDGSPQTGRCEPDHNTAVASLGALRLWWSRSRSCWGNREPARVLVCAYVLSSGIGYLRPWRSALSRFAEEAGMELTVSHLPKVTMKWEGIRQHIRVMVSSGDEARRVRHMASLFEVGMPRGERDGAADVYQGVDAVDTDAEPEESPRVNRRPHEFNGMRNYDVVPDGGTS